MRGLLRYLNFSDIDQLRYFGMLILAFVFSISVHEFAHAYSAYRLGDKTAYHQGRMTLNPFAHLDWIGSLLLLFVGVGYAKAVPVNPWNFDEKVGKRKGMLLVALAGPFSNLCLAMIATFFNAVLNVIFLKWMALSSEVLLNFYVDLSVFLALFVTLNLSLAAFNLIPVPPLDGFQIVSYFLPGEVLRTISQFHREIRIGFLLILSFFPGIFHGILSIIEYPLNLINNLWNSLLNFLFFL